MMEGDAMIPVKMGRGGEKRVVMAIYMCVFLGVGLGCCWVPRDTGRLLLRSKRNDKLQLGQGSLILPWLTALLKDLTELWLMRTTFLLYTLRSLGHFPRLQERQVITTQISNHFEPFSYSLACVVGMCRRSHGDFFSTRTHNSTPQELPAASWCEARRLTRPPLI